MLRPFSFLIAAVLLALVAANENSSSHCSSSCVHGFCSFGICICERGWLGKNCTNHAEEESDQSCSDLQTCEQCQQNPMCGWCSNSSRTDTGVCMEGGNEGPIRGNQLNQCPTDQWHFTDCPKCDCKNRGICHPKTGKCFCTTRGVIGDQCEKCDENNYYFGDPTNGDTCFYDLTTDFQFTFNLSKPGEPYTNINFKNTPPKKSNKSINFFIACSKLAYMNVFAKTGDKPVRLLVEDGLCTYYRTKFPYAAYEFDSGENTTFYVNVYGFQTPAVFQIAFYRENRLGEKK